MYTFRIFSLLAFTVFFVLNCTAADVDNMQKKVTVKKIGADVQLGVVVTEPEEGSGKKGAKIMHVIEGSSADDIGLEENDIIISFDGTEIESAKELNDLVESIDEEKQVNLIVIRDGAEKSFDVNLKKSDKGIVSIGLSSDGNNFTWKTNKGDKDISWFSDDGEDIIVSKIPGEMNIFSGGSHSKGGFLGVSTSNIKKQMLEYFEVDHGVLIDEVIEDSPAEKAGLKAGDVITIISGRKIEDYSDLIRTINYYNPGEDIKIEFVRKGSVKNTTAELAEKENKMFFGGNGVFEIAPDAAVAPEIHKNFQFKSLGGKSTFFVL